jgi:hypothetical protein
MLHLSELFDRLPIAGYGSRPSEAHKKPEKNHASHCAKQRSRTMSTDNAIPNETISIYWHDFLGANLTQKGHRNQFVDETRIVPLIACVLAILGASLCTASQ